MKFLDLFSGIGGFRLGMEQSGHECVGYVEWDKYARKSYEAIHEPKGEWTRHDITEVTNEEWRQLRGTVDAICAGFPCPTFSFGGKREGFNDPRGLLFFELARAAEQIKPRYLFIENVKGLLSNDKGRTFGVILNKMDELGYDVEWELCNSKTFVPQNRERVFIIGHLRGTGGRKVFPLGETNGTSDIQVKVIAHRKNYRRNTLVFDPSGITETLDTAQGGGRGHYTVEYDRETGVEEGLKVREATSKGYAIAHEGDSINLTAPRSTTRRGRVGKGIANTIDTSQNQGVLLNCENPKIYDFSQSKREGKPRIYEENAPTLTARDYKEPRCVSHGMRIRRLTPKECFRLQGFPDWAFERAQSVNSDSQLYKQAGNTVTVPLIKVIADRLEG